MDKDKNPIFEMKEVLTSLSEVVEAEAKQQYKKLLDLKEQLPEMIKNNQRLDTQKGVQQDVTNFNPMINFNPDKLDEVNEQLNKQSEEFLSQMKDAEKKLKEFNDKLEKEFLSTQEMRDKFAEAIPEDLIDKEELETDYEKKKKDIMERLNKKLNG